MACGVVPKTYTHTADKPAGQQNQYKMKIVVIGGTGLIGSKLTAKLKALNHEVMVAVPSTGVNTLTGEGLDEAFAGAQIVVDLANSPNFEDEVAMHFFKTAGANIFAAEKKAGVGYHIALSVVGTSRLLASGYFRAKQEQERIIETSGVPYTIVHSTQFYEFMAAIVASATVGEEVRVPPAAFQPIAAEDVAESLKDIVLGTPQNKIVEIAGPERKPQDEFVRTYMQATGDKRKLLRDVHALYFGIALNDESLVPAMDPAPRLGKIRFTDYLAQQGGKQANRQSKK